MPHKTEFSISAAFCLFGGQGVTQVATKEKNMDDLVTNIKEMYVRILGVN